VLTVAAEAHYQVGVTLDDAAPAPTNVPLLSDRERQRLIGGPNQPVMVSDKGANKHSNRRSNSRRGAPANKEQAQMARNDAGRLDTDLVAPVIENDGNFWISVAARQRWRWFVVGNEIAVKKYVVRLSGGTRPTRRVDPQRQSFRPAADEGPHPAEGGRIGGRRRLERQPDCRALDTSIATIERTRRQLVGD
jgi:hypothetical protein